MQLSEQEIVRRTSLKRLRELGINPYPAAQFKVTNLTKELIENFDTFEGKEVVVAGRMMSRRIMGKASFTGLKDSSGLMQIYVNRDELAPGEDKIIYNEVFKHLLDI
ncbi:MAG: lysine--tRNA ligase, partial [Zetaproteobacteria bacterium]|nr:lysine--tRNA ligase [Flavobacteriales bacterium]